MFDFIVTLATTLVGVAALAVLLLCPFIYELKLGRKRLTEAEALKKHFSPTKDTAGNVPEASKALASFDNQSILNKDQFLLVVSLYGAAKARYDTLTYHSRCDLVEMNASQADAIIRYRATSTYGQNYYGNDQIFIKWPEVSPAEFMEAFDRSYNATVKETVEAIQAASVAAN